MKIKYLEPVIFHFCLSHVYKKTIIFNLYLQFFCSDLMLLTTSLDTTIKVFATNTEINKAELKFDRSETEITKLSLLGSTRAITQVQSSK
jgi:hypothetical protein